MFQLYIIPGDRKTSFIFRLTCGKVERDAMQWTGKQGPIKRALVKESAFMRAVPPYGEIVPLYIKDDYCPSLPLNYLSAVRRYISYKCNLYKRGHLAII